MKNIKRGHIFRVFLTICLIGLIPIAACRNQQTETVEPVPKKWSVLFYLACDGNVSNIMQFLAEYIYSGDNMNVILMDDNRNKPGYIWYIDTFRRTSQIKNIGEPDTGDPFNLIYFINYCKKNYPAERYILNFYSHGSAWFGVAWDESSGDGLTMNDMKQAITDAGGVDMICFTAPCLMGCVESAYEVRDCADVYVASENLSGIGPWPNTFARITELLDSNPDMATEMLAKKIVDNIAMQGFSEHLTMSAIRLSKVEQLVKTISAMSNNYLNFPERFIPHVQNNINIFRRYDGQFIDLYDFTEKMQRKETDPQTLDLLLSIQNQLKEAVIGECHSKDQVGSHGLSIYFPLEKPSASDFISKYYQSNEYGLDFTTHTCWDELLLMYFEQCPLFPLHHLKSDKQPAF